MEKTVINPKFRFLSGFIKSLPEIFPKEGTTIYKGRNEVKLFQVQDLDVVVKSFKIPHYINKIAYAHLRLSKAERSYTNARLLQDKGIGTPTPIGYMFIIKNGLFEKSYYISLKSRFSREFREVAISPKTDETGFIVSDFGAFSAEIHKKNILHKDYTPGNVLFGKVDNHFEFELVDTNRMEMMPVDMKTACKNMNSFCISEEMYRLLARKYAQGRGFDPDECEKMMLKYMDPDA